MDYERPPTCRFEPNAEQGGMRNRDGTSHTNPTLAPTERCAFSSEKISGSVLENQTMIRYGIQAFAGVAALIAGLSGGADLFAQHYGHHGYGHHGHHGHHGFGHRGHHGFGHRGHHGFGHRGHHGFGHHGGHHRYRHRYGHHGGHHGHHRYRPRYYSFSYRYRPHYYSYRPRHHSGSHGHSGSTYGGNSSHGGGTYGGSTYGGSSGGTYASGDGWDLLAQGQPSQALNVFAQQAESNPRYGVPKVGYALAAAARGDEDTGVWAMRRACRIDPDSMRKYQLQKDVVPVVDNLVARYRGRLDSGGRRDAAFMLASLHYLKRDGDSAREAAQIAANNGDRSTSFRHLQQMISSLPDDQPDPRNAGPSEQNGAGQKKDSPSQRTFRPPSAEPDQPQPHRRLAPPKPPIPQRTPEEPKKNDGNQPPTPSIDV